ncbi:MAG: hypothetical protein HY361_01255 [Candidatus Aenigmarchaeota archaeon]|nr:hypothetical protein [Candidatus Aenigmarchaeota archaeon]
MVFGLEGDKREDWKEFLIPEAKQTLSNLIDSVKRHRGAYSHADDVKIAQLWSALIEIKNELDGVKQTLGKLEDPWRAIVELGDVEKRKTVEKLVEELIKPVDEDTKEATKKLVDSLMKF